MINMRGNTLPTRMPDRRLSPACCVTAPTRLGPKAPPRSPAMARRANSAVPPRGIRGDVMLIVPGHIMPTEKPQKTQPISPRTGFAHSDARRYQHSHRIPEAIINRIRFIFAPYLP